MSQTTLQRTISLLIPFLWPKNKKSIKIRVSLAVLCLLFAKVANVGTPPILGYAVDSLTELSQGINIYMLIPLALIISYGVARVAALAFGELRNAIFSKVAQNAITQLTLNTFKHLHSLSLQFHLGRQTGALSKFIDRGTKGVNFLLNYVLFNVIPTIIEIFLVAGILAFIYGLKYAFVTLITIILYVIVTFTVTQWRLQFRRRMNVADNAVSTKLIDSLLNFETVKYFNNEEHEYRRLFESLDQYEIESIKNQYSLSYLNIFQTVVIMTGITIMLSMSAFDIRAGNITIGGFVVINAYMLQLYQPLNFFGTVYREIRQSLTDMENLFTLWEEKPNLSDGAEKILEIEEASIRFENVSFDYDARRTIIKDISFEVPNGKKVALVGPTGAGKSTISRLLFRFYDPKQGDVYINNQNIKDISQQSLRKHIGVVPQDTVLFNDTIYYNISYGNPNANEEEIYNAAKSADIHNFIINLPDGYQTIVGERGLKLSGGEKQRVAIARAILKNPSIFFFDEATSALDSTTEKEIQKNLQAISKNRTTLVIAHRLSTAADADEILVLEQGEITERGNHEELLSKKGKYSEMWNKQKSSIDLIHA
ncbi:ABC transporter ATP-binding protein/permease [Alphaproteobacteria bacterium]|nr:ABC transporter ATP-binding protein/permease [Alphaproteobacteria bacterium]MDB3973620.1 ABC transporter ATP-binding protein/permease [Alphaproteobacteria bacterium]